MGLVTDTAGVAFFPLKHMEIMQILGSVSEIGLGVFFRFNGALLVAFVTGGVQGRFIFCIECCGKRCFEEVGVGAAVSAMAGRTIAFFHRRMQGLGVFYLVGQADNRSFCRLNCLAVASQAKFLRGSFQQVFLLGEMGRVAISAGFSLNLGAGWMGERLCLLKDFCVTAGTERRFFSFEQCGVFAFVCPVALGAGIAGNVGRGGRLRFLSESRMACQTEFRSTGFEQTRMVRLVRFMAFQALAFSQRSMGFFGRGWDSLVATGTTVWTAPFFQQVTIAGVNFVTDCTVPLKGAMRVGFGSFLGVTFET